MGHTRVIVSAAVIDALADLDLAYPKVHRSKLKETCGGEKQTAEKIADVDFSCCATGYTAS
jgi:hypothetical protein